MERGTRERTLKEIEETAERTTGAGASAPAPEDRSDYKRQ